MNIVRLKNIQSSFNNSKTIRWGLLNNQVEHQRKKNQARLKSSFSSYSFSWERKNRRWGGPCWWQGQIHFEGKVVLVINAEFFLASSKIHPSWFTTNHFIFHSWILYSHCCNWKIRANWHSIFCVCYWKMCWWRNIPPSSPKIVPSALFNFVLTTLSFNLLLVAETNSDLEMVQHR